VETAEALSLAVTYTDLRRLAQDRIAREIASAADERSSSATAIAWGVSGGAGALLILVVFLGVTVSSSISRPLRRLTRAAGVVAELSGAELLRIADSESLDPAPPRLTAVEVDSADEIGELATALNRVQATAALLLERQVSNRRNVSVMFANIARRTQNLVGRQLALIDDLERNERNPELLQRLYRLDHIATRLRRSADSLLVVSGTIDQHCPAHRPSLAEIIRSSPGRDRGLPGGRARRRVRGRGDGVGRRRPAAVLAEVAGERDELLPARQRGTVTAELAATARSGSSTAAWGSAGANGRREPAPGRTRTTRRRTDQRAGAVRGRPAGPPPRSVRPARVVG
jgi:hypothetical protein